MKTKLDAVELSRKLIQIPSINPPGDEEACAKYLAELLQDDGFKVHLHSFGKRRFNLIADLFNDKTTPVLCFTGHLDTVPLGSTPWNRAPLSGDIVDGRLYGRGSTDMKAGIAAFIEACQIAKEQRPEGLNVRLILTGGEETGCDGARALIADATVPFREIDALLIGEPTLNYPFIGHKGALWLRGRAQGVTAHSAMPEEGENAVYKAIRAIEKIQNFTLDGQHPVMGKPSMNIGRFNGGLNINSVPDKAEFEVDFRTVPGMVHGCMHKELAQLLEEDVELSTIVDVPALYSDIENPWIQQVFELCAADHDGKLTAKTVPYFTDGSVLTPACGMPPTVILGPGDPKQAHKINEYCSVDLIQKSVGVYVKILLEFSSKSFENS